MNAQKSVCGHLGAVMADHGSQHWVSKAVHYGSPGPAVSHSGNPIKYLYQEA